MSDLVEIKKGETGRGLLIERDGRLNAHQDIVNQIREDISRNKQFVIPDRFIVSGVFQRYDAVNHNGRIYPKDILVPEIDRYIREAVNNRCAFGALDHPECFPPEVNMLTNDGWKRVADVKVGERVLTLNRDTMEIELKEVVRKIDEPYRGKMVRLRGEGIDISSTPNHRYPLFDGDGAFVTFRTAREIMERSVPGRDALFLAGGLRAGDVPSDGWISVAEGSLEAFEEDYDGTVHCVEVGNHTFYAQCNGKMVWSGNSSSLSGHDVSHNIIELHWEGQTLVGQMELQLTPGYKRYGVASTSGDLVANLLINDYLIGVSSRALGNVVQKYGKTYVDDSLEIVAFDVVLTPSTNCAYISANPEDVQRFVQMDRSNPLSESIKKIGNMLL